jgi:AP-1 complex subunit beta-1
LCVAKLYDLNPELALESGFVETLQEMVSDINPMVVANAVVALSDINEASPETVVFKIAGGTLNKLLHALNECTEWGQISILTALADYKAGDVKEAEGICDRVLPRLQHANGSVVLSAIKVLMINMRLVKDANFNKNLVKKMAPPLGKHTDLISVFFHACHSNVSPRSSYLVVWTPGSTICCT